MQDDNSQLDTQLFKMEKQLENFKTIQNLYQQCGDHFENVNTTYEVELNEERERNRALETRLGEVEKQVKHLLNVNREAGTLMRSQELQLSFLRRQLDERDQENREAKEMLMWSERRFDKTRRCNAKLKTEVEALGKRWREVKSRVSCGGESDDDLESVIQTGGYWKDSTLLGCGYYCCDSERKDTQTELPGKESFHSADNCVRKRKETKSLKMQSAALCISGNYCDGEMKGTQCQLQNKESFHSRENEVTERKGTQSELPSGGSFLSGDDSVRERKDTLGDQYSGAQLLSGENCVRKRNNAPCEVSSRESFLSGDNSVREKQDTLGGQDSAASFLSGDNSVRESKDTLSGHSGRRRVTTPSGSDVTRLLPGSRGSSNRGVWGEVAILDILKEKSESYGVCGKDMVIDILKDLVTRECLERTAMLDQRVATSGCLSSRVCSSCSELLGDQEKKTTPRQAEKNTKRRCGGEGLSKPKKPDVSRFVSKLLRPRNGDKRKTRRIGKHANHLRRLTKQEQNVPPVRRRKPRQTFCENGNSRLRNVVGCKTTKSPYETWKNGTVKAKKKKTTCGSKVKSSTKSLRACQIVALSENPGNKNVTTKQAKCVFKQNNNAGLKHKQKLKAGRKPTKRSKVKENGKSPTRRHIRTSPTRSENRVNSKARSNMNGKSPSTGTRLEHNLESPTTERKSRDIGSHQKHPNPIHASPEESKSPPSSSTSKKHFSSLHINFRFSKQSTSIPSHILKLNPIKSSLQNTCKSAPSYVISPARSKVTPEDKRQVPLTTIRTNKGNHLKNRRPNTVAYKKT